HEGAVLSADDQEHDVDEGDASAAAPDQCHPLEVQERRAEDAAGNDGPLPDAQGQSARRLPADDRADSYLLRALRGAVGVRGTAEPTVHLLRTNLRHRLVDLRPGGARSDVYPSAVDGGIDVHPAEDDPRDG